MGFVFVTPKTEKVKEEEVRKRADRQRLARARQASQQQQTVTQQQVQTQPQVQQASQQQPKSSSQVQDAYDYVIGILELVQDMIKSVNARVCKACYDNLAYIRPLIDGYAIPEKRAKLAELYNKVVEQVNSACKGIEEAEKTRQIYEQQEQIVKLSPAGRLDPCKSYLRSVMEWWESAGYQKDMKKLFDYFFNRLEGTKECEPYMDTLEKMAREKGFT